jgi:hypothetical protein
MNYTVIVTYSDGEQIATDFADASKATRFAQSEVKYENTLSAKCQTLGLDLQGDFAFIHLGA